MKKIISTLNLPHEEWLAYRKTGIGGSDAGAVAGLNPFSSPMNVYQDKISSSTPDMDNESMRQGRDLEDYVAKRFMEASGLKVRRSNAMYRHDKYPFMLADIDRMVVGENAGLECKTASAYSADKWKDGQIPPHYLIQCHHYMAVMGADHWYLAVVLLGKEFKYTRIERDEELISNLIAIESAFWFDHVIPQIMPEPDGSKACDEVLEQYFHLARKDSSVLLIGFDEKLERREEIIRLKEKLEQEQRQIEQEVKLYMKDSETAFNDRYRVMWSNVDTARLDTQRIKSERPELYRDFTKVTSSRRFTVRAA
ncbi:YqaJ viral recombinase family protein [Clostridium transplantifaecale]|uniref:YqaJ viral recombinase family nuclease n=1 Tax=Clostridium transplantifaecale TaxID=2479838 RepID=UPI000F638718|nr:YqaJ viral recombinase family protein [Clostridium transplantifaecale]